MQTIWIKMSEVLIKLPCFVNMQHMWSLLNSNNGAKKFRKCEWTSLNWQSYNDTGSHPHRTTNQLSQQPAALSL